MSDLASDSCTILLVDDDESFRPALRKGLQKLGYTVLTASNGQDAKTILGVDSTIDIVVSDIRMPKVDGMELTRHVKTLDRVVPVILITAFSDILETQEAHQLGADDFLAKPLDREELVDSIERCVAKARIPNIQQEELDDQYCRLGIDDFASGRQIQFSIFLKVGAKYIKIAHTGEDLSQDRIRVYKGRGVNYLFVRREDFRQYVGFNLSLDRSIRSTKSLNRDRRNEILKAATETLNNRVPHEGVDEGNFDGAVAFVQTTVDVISEDPNALELLEALNSHVDYLFAHSVGVSLYGVLIAREVGWSLPNNKFKVAMGGLFHDIGEKDFSTELLSRPRSEWTADEMDAYENHPAIGAEAVAKISLVTTDVLQIVREHAEETVTKGYPTRIRRGSIHPMAKLVAVADEFCERVIKGPKSAGISPHEALREMNQGKGDKLETQYMEALMRLFKYETDKEKA